MRFCWCPQCSEYWKGFETFISLIHIVRFFIVFLRLAFRAVGMTSPGDTSGLTMTGSDHLQKRMQQGMTREIQCFKRNTELFQVLLVCVWILRQHPLLKISDGLFLPPWIHPVTFWTHIKFNIHNFQWQETQFMWRIYYFGHFEPDIWAFNLIFSSFSRKENKNSLFYFHISLMSSALCQNSSSAQFVISLVWKS